MKVLLLGAGASVPAGYPPAAKLLDCLEKHALASPKEDVQKAWSSFRDFRASACGPVARILKSSNPEIVLSLIDLYVAAKETEEQDWWRSLQQLGQQEGASASPPLRYPTQADFGDAVSALRACVTCIEDYFYCLHYEDFDSQGLANVGYLKRELQALREGDVVITTNWDSLVERVLMQNRLWALLQ